MRTGFQGETLFVFFFAVCERQESRRRLSSEATKTDPIYIEQLGSKASKSTVKQYLAAILQLLDDLTMASWT
jgi:hypothetical protein